MKGSLDVHDLHKMLTAFKLNYKYEFYDVNIELIQNCYDFNFGI